MKDSLFDDDGPKPTAHTHDPIRKGEQATRDGDPRLAAERKRKDLAFRKRTRAGPHWVPRDRRPT